MLASAMPSGSSLGRRSTNYKIGRQNLPIILIRSLTTLRTLKTLRTLETLNPSIPAVVAPQPVHALRESALF